MAQIILDGIPVGYEEELSLECSGIVYSHSVCIWPQYQGKGYGKRAHEARLKRFRDSGYQLAICTVRADNGPQLHILKGFGWQHLYSYESYGEIIYYMVRDLNQDISWNP